MSTLFCPAVYLLFTQIIMLPAPYSRILLIDEKLKIFSVVGNKGNRVTIKGRKQPEGW